jgi:CBS domain containing-hemolysin-like protein
MFAHINICTFCWCMGNLCSMSLVFQFVLVFVQVMQALPIFLDRMFNEWVAVILSVTFVLAFGEVMPQAICSRFGLAVGANMVWLVKILMWICFPVAYPVGLVISFPVDISHKGCLPSYEWRNSQRITFLQSSVLEHSSLTF